MSVTERVEGVWGRAMVLADRLVPPRLRQTNHEGAKALLFVRAWLATILFASTMVVLEGAQGLPGQVALNAVMVVLGPILLLRLRAGASLDLLIKVSLWVASAGYALGSLAQTPFDITSVFFLVVVPMLAGFFFGGRQAVAWMFLTLGMGLVAILLGLNGYTLPQRDPDASITAVVNFTFLMVLVVLAGIGIHDLKDRAFRRLDAASRAKSAFLANMSHEIRTPMNGVLGLTEVMLMEPLPPHQRERLEVIKRSGEVLVALVSQVLDLARIEAGKLELSEGPVQLAAMARDVQELFGALAQQKGLALCLELHPALPEVVVADATRLRQVLFNLVSNAVKFTEAGQVRLSLTPAPEGKVRFAVEDTGIGIPADLMPRLFSPFEQADSSSTRRFGGSGLGLALSRQVVALMGGSLEVSSQAGIGSTFFFSLRLEPAQPEVASAPAAAPRRGGRVLVVDDNAVNLKVASSLVQKAGYAVTTATNGREALALFEAQHFDVVLMDCHMPEMDGFEATRRLRASAGAGAVVPIFALSASTLPEDQARCKAAGMDGFLSKPVTLAKLAEALTNGRRNLTG